MTELVATFPSLADAENVGREFGITDGRPVYQSLDGDVTVAFTADAETIARFNAGPNADNRYSLELAREGVPTRLYAVAESLAYLGLPTPVDVLFHLLEVHDDAAKASAETLATGVTV